MTTIKDVMKLAFIAGQMSGVQEARNRIFDEQKKVTKFEDILNDVYWLELDSEVRIKEIELTKIKI